MKFIFKSIGSSVAGMLGGWLGNFVGIGTSLFLGFTLSIVGWYLTKYWLDNQGL